MDYGSEIWGHKNIKTMTTLQKKCIRHVVKTRNHILHTNQAFIQLQTPKFFDIITYNSSRLGYKLVHANYPPGLREDFLKKKPNSERRKFDLSPQFPLSDKIKHLPLFMIPQVWNDIPQEFRQPTDPENFKFNIKGFILNTYRTLPPCSRKNCVSCLPNHPFLT